MGLGKATKLAHALLDRYLRHSTGDLGLEDFASSSFIDSKIEELKAVIKARDFDYTFLLSLASDYVGDILSSAPCVKIRKLPKPRKKKINDYRIRNTTAN